MLGDLGLDRSAAAQQEHRSGAEQQGGGGPKIKGLCGGVSVLMKVNWR
jgi:hypothetical protein